MEKSLRTGKLLRWNDHRGFGFIQPSDGSQEVFLHISELKDATRRPQDGDTIYYYTKLDKTSKIRACNAFIVEARKKLGDAGNASHTVSKYPFPMLEALLLAIVPLIGSIHFTLITTNPTPLVVYPVMSWLTFIIYADDKSRAKRRQQRTSEKTLHLCELAGGWLGGFIAQRMIRHKSKKTSYQIVFWAIVALHWLVWLVWLFQGEALLYGTA